VIKEMSLVLNQDKFDEALVKHKKILACLRFADMQTEEGQKKSSGRFMMLERTGRELALAYSGLKCERCKSENNLQFHHMIMRQIKEFTDFYRYETQRKYWANILVLCGACHYEIHTSIKHRPDLKLFIKPELINHVKKKFYNEVRDETTTK
jgi:hypothetical protein